MLTAAERMQLKNGTERILHVPGNYKGGILEMTLVCDYRLPEEKLRERTKDVIGLLKQQGGVFQNVRFNLVKWAADKAIRKETHPMACAATGRVFEDYLELQERELRGLQSLDELTRQLRLFFARSKLVILLTGGEYAIVDEKKVRENMQPFLHKKLLVWEQDEILYGTEFMLKRLRQKGKDGNMENRAFVFDMDGVLFDTERFYMEAWREIAKEQELGDLEEAVQGCVGLNYGDTKRFFLDRYGSNFPYDTYMQACAGRFQEKVEAFGVPVKTGVYELLEYLKQENYRIGLASSTKREKVLSHLEQAGIREYFHAVVGGDMVERGKPAPDIYLAACRELGAVPKDTFAAEDSPNGIRSAGSAGLKTIMVPDLIQPDLELESLLYARCRNLTEVKYLLMGLKISRIPLEGIGNTRDLGGIPLGNGRHILPGRLFRSGALYGTTQEDRRRLVEEYGLKTVVDFRTGTERQDKPDPELPGVKNIWNPILEEAALGITREEGPREKNVIREVVEKTASQENGGEKYMRDMYVNLIRDPYSRKKYRRFFEILLEQEEGALLWHCSAGKDRAGLASALLLSALGADRETVLADYMKTNQFCRAEVNGMLAQILKHGQFSPHKEKETLNGLRYLFIVEAGFLEAVFEQAEKEYGGMDAFLEQEMGLTPQKRKKLQAMYTA